MKVASLLVRAGYVQAVRGRGGGMQLAQPPEALRLGAVVRTCEPHMNLVECFDRATDTCPITPACKLRGVLLEATRSFLEVLDGDTLADFPASAADGQRLVQLWADRHALAG